MEQQGAAQGGAVGQQSPGRGTQHGKIGNRQQYGMQGNNGYGMGPAMHVPPEMMQVRVGIGWDAVVVGSWMEQYAYKCVFDHVKLTCADDNGIFGSAWSGFLHLAWTCPYALCSVGCQAAVCARREEVLLDKADRGHVRYFHTYDMRDNAILCRGWDHQP